VNAAKRTSNCSNSVSKAFWFWVCTWRPRFCDWMYEMSSLTACENYDSENETEPVFKDFTLRWILYDETKVSIPSSSRTASSIYFRTRPTRSSSSRKA
jgi:hypothetical protein